MNKHPKLEPIGYIRTDFKEKFGVPRQSGLVESAKGTIVFEKKYQNPDAFRGLEDFSHLWVIWQFSHSVMDDWTPTVRPPRLGGNIRKGVFATRSPFRPNPIAMSCLKLDSIEFSEKHGPLIRVSGVDMVDKTPIYDIKPYIYTDCHPEAVSGFAEKTSEHSLKVIVPEELVEIISEEKLETLMDVLSIDPRPGYQSDPDRIYGMSFAGYDVSFCVNGGVLKVIDLKEYE